MRPVSESRIIATRIAVPGARKRAQKIQRVELSVRWIECQSVLQGRSSSYRPQAEPFVEAALPIATGIDRHALVTEGGELRDEPLVNVRFERSR